jgi:hypothetical protein
MAPENTTEVLNLESIGPSRVNNNKTRIDDHISVITREKQKRITIYHWVVHILAFLIVIPYLAMLIAQQPVPDTYVTIVSVVIGFYFAKSLFNE